jgi:threonine dehydrogenase-like Zn-dependent dehydrogenase
VRQPLLRTLPTPATRRSGATRARPKPKVIEDTDVILKITGSTVCGSDLHLLHGTVVELQKGDILGHEFCGIVDEVGSAVTKFQKGYVWSRSYFALFVNNLTANVS